MSERFDGYLRRRCSTHCTLVKPHSSNLQAEMKLCLITAIAVAFVGLAIANENAEDIAFQEPLSGGEITLLKEKVH